MGGGSNDSKSKPLSGVERQDIFNRGMEAIMGVPGQTMWGPDFRKDAPGYSAPKYERMGDGDYDRLEKNVYNSMSAPLKRYESEERQRVDQDIADRGLYTSGIAVDAQNDLTERVAPQYAAMGGQAVQARYGMEQADKSLINQLSQQDATQDYMARWAPYEYLLNLFNTTQGNVSKSSGWNVSI